jgi:hypothetical protein
MIPRLLSSSTIRSSNCHPLTSAARACLARELHREIPRVVVQNRCSKPALTCAQFDAVYDELEDLGVQADTHAALEPRWSPEAKASCCTVRFRPVPSVLQGAYHAPRGWLTFTSSSASQGKMTSSLSCPALPATPVTV